MTSKSLDDAVSITASEAVDTFPVSKLLDPLGSGRWRSITGTPNIVVEFAAPQTIRRWGFFYHNAVDGDTVRLRQADTLAGLTAAPDKDETVSLIPGVGADLSSFEFIHQRSTVATPETRLWARLDLSVAGGFFEAGALKLDSGFDLFRGVDFGFQLKPTVRALHSVNLSAGGTGRGGGSFKQDAQLTFPHMTEDEVLGELMPLLRDRRRVKPVVGVIRSNEDLYPMDFMVYGYIDVDGITFKEIEHEVVVPFLEP